MFLAISHLLKVPVCRRIALLILTSALAALLAGCGGSGSQNSTTLLQGDAAFRSASVASYQSLGAGIAYPFVALKSVSPASSPLHTRSAAQAGTKAVSLTGASRSGARAASSRAAGLTFVPGLNLYVDSGTFNGHAFALNYFTDAAGTQSAGAVTMTVPAGASAPITYASFPIQIPIAVNITGGNLPCHGNAVLTFTGSSGANSLVGDFTLTKDNVPFHIDLTLSDLFDVSGTITIKESGATVTATNIHGNLLTPLQCDVTVAPLGWTGTGTLNLTTGEISLRLNTGAGVSTTTTDGSGNLTLTYADGKTETVNNALLAGLVSGSAGGGTNGGGNGTYVPLPTNFRSRQINNAGQLLGVTGNNFSQGAFLDSASAQVVTLQTVGSQSPRAIAMNNSGQIIGSAAAPLFWSSAAAAPTVLNTTGYSGVTLFGITDTGQILGIGGFPNAVLYWANATAAPVALPLPTQQSLLVTSLAVSSGGQIVGLLNSQVGVDNFQYVYWQSPTAQPVTLAPLPTGETPRTLFINTKSQIVASSLEGHAYLWSSPSAQPTQLPALTHGTIATMQALGLNNNGLIIGRANFGSSSSLAVYWKAGQVTDINTLLPAGQTLILDVALSINDQGQVVCDNIGEVVGNVGDVIVTIK